ncbi:unnamed protein product [Bursaphelenchus xylophilus]|uniref:(pine wood nematode) hypothetical protein n=1 Tax=Bursaphelenchus xylophilus TaxID=6326 RepID=A0A7I8XAB6_BURXY|nr:unnamed protein product [Bursaphelenchus xylophilus]CAG9082740.1 unnamed protein product [Bursaphelenchus xylophilus]
MDMPRRVPLSDVKPKKNRLSSTLNGRITKDKHKKKKEELQLAQSIMASAQIEPAHSTVSCHNASHVSGRLVRCETCNAWYRG